MRPRIIPLEEYPKIASRHASGEKREAIAMDYNCSVSAISRIALEAGAPRRSWGGGMPFRISPSEYGELLSYAKTESYRELAIRYNCTIVTIYNTLKRARKCETQKHTG